MWGFLTARVSYADITEPKTSHSPMKKHQRQRYQIQLNECDRNGDSERRTVDQDGVVVDRN
jgi:hypothetical protein